MPTIQIPDKLYISLCRAAERLNVASSSIIEEALAIYLIRLGEHLGECPTKLRSLNDDNNEKDKKIMIRKLNKRDEELIHLTIKKILDVAGINLRKDEKYYERRLDEDEQYIENPLEIYSSMVSACISNSSNFCYFSRYVGLHLLIHEIKEKLGKNKYYTYDFDTGEFTEIQR